MTNEYIWSKIIGLVRDLELMSHEEHLEKMKIFILENADSGDIDSLNIYSLKGYYLKE